MFEQRHEPLLPPRQFIRRMLHALALAMSVVAVALGIGILGYHFFAALPWVDALLNASMILTGMGPVDTLRTTGAKVFASGYALFSGIIFISAMGLLLSPVAHRVLHRFHISEEDLKTAQEKDGEEKKSTGKSAAKSAGTRR